MMSRASRRRAPSVARLALALVAAVLLIGACSVQAGKKKNGGKNPSSSPSSSAGFTLGPFSSVCTRRELGSLMSSATYARHKDLLLLSMRAMMDADPNDPQSYFQLAKIHGEPFVAYNGVTNLASPWRGQANRWGGYCDHGAYTFPTWHRAYMVALEQVLRRTAADIAESYPTATRTAYRQAAADLCLPYWDWADRAIGAKGTLPDILLTPTVSINTPAGQRTIDNPLYSYTYPYNLNNGDLPGPGGTSTARQPPTSDRTSYLWDTDNQAFVRTFVRLQPQLRQGILDLMSISNWECFASHSAQGCVFGSIEALHDTVHNNVGGKWGDMTDLATAGFDPIFWFHHANVDRLMALWQVAYPRAWVVPGTSTTGSWMYAAGTTLTAKSPLYPFKTTSGSWVTSNDVYDVTSLGYTYAELGRYRTLEAVRSYLKLLYSKASGYNFNSVAPASVASAAATTTAAVAATTVDAGKVQASAASPASPSFRWFLVYTCNATAGPTQGGLGVNTTFVGQKPVLVSSDTSASFHIGPGLSAMASSHRASLEVTEVLVAAGRLDTQVQPAVEGKWAAGPDHAPFSPADDFSFDCFDARGGQDLGCECAAKVGWAVDPSAATKGKAYYGVLDDDE